MVSKKVMDLSALALLLSGFIALLFKQTTLSTMLVLIGALVYLVAKRIIS
jgi:hypothetical protein